MITEDSKIHESNKLNDKLNLKNPNKNISLVNLSIYYAWRNIKSSYYNNKFKYMLNIEMMNLISLMDHILYLIYKIILNTLLNNMRL